MGKGTAGLTSSIILWTSAAAAQPGPIPQHIPAPGGEVILTSPFDEQIYREDHLSAVRRANGFLFFSGSVVGATAPIDGAEFERRLDKLFALLSAKLKEAGSTPADVASIHSYHAWRNPKFLGTKADHITIFEKVKDRYFAAPYPTWTAVGVDQLYSDNGLVEVELMAVAKR